MYILLLKKDSTYITVSCGGVLLYCGIGTICLVVICILSIVIQSLVWSFNFLYIFVGTYYCGKPGFVLVTVGI